ncbi:MAG: hypothetical protein V2I50_14710 [Desulfuromusa sp.]|nr:hypothetical protein [Desulfuromusa sp.]
MKKVGWHSKWHYLFKTVLLLFSGVLFALIVSCGGGGGGGSSDIEDDSDVDIDAVLWSYEAGWDIGSDDPLSFVITRQEDTVSVTINGFRVTGNYHLETDEVTLVSGNWFNVTADETGYGELNITIIEPVSWMMGDYPAAGAFNVLMEDQSEIRLTANANVDGFGTAGVDIVSGDQSVSLTWAEFEDIPDLLFDDDYRHIANFSYKVWVFIYERIYYTFRTLITVTDHEAELESAGSGNIGYTQSCEMFPPTGGETGTRQFSYVDISGNSALGPGDNFNLILTSCWIEGGRDEEGVIIDGELELNGYIENVTADDDLISLGFVDVNFVNFVEQPVEEEAGVYSLSTFGTITTNGKYSLWLMPL